MRTLDVSTLRARNAVAVVFALNGFAFASWVARIPEVRSALDLTPGRLGVLLLALSVGSVVALPTAGAWVRRLGAARVVGAAAVLGALGLLVTGLGTGLWSASWAAAAGLLLLGYGSGTWDVAMNVEGAAVEHRLGRTIMPRFHAAFSLGTVAGAALGALSAGIGLAVAWHLGLVALVVATAAPLAVRRFVAADPGVAPGADPGAEPDGGPGSSWRAWREPRTVAIGVMVLAMALTEGVANDWLAVALVDGYDVSAWLGAAGFALFVAAMTTGRVAGPGVLDRFGRVRVLWTSMAVAAAGVLLVVLGGDPVLVVAGICLWGLGASLGFPVGMSAAADEPAHAPARVSVVATIGYTAFLAGPPVLGFVADRVGVLNALLLVAVLLVPSALVVPSVRRPGAVGASGSPPPGDSPTEAA